MDQTLDMEVVFTRPKAATAELTLIMPPTSHGHMKNLKFTFEITSTTILTNMKNQVVFVFWLNRKSQNIWLFLFNKK